MTSKGFLSTWFASSVAIAFAALVMGDHMNVGTRGVPLYEQVFAVAIVGLIFTLVHLVIGRIVKLLSLPFIFLTLGLLLLVINALLLMLTEWITSNVGIHFFVDGFWWAVLGSIVISLAQTIVASLVEQ